MSNYAIKLLKTRNGHDLVLDEASKMEFVKPIQYRDEYLRMQIAELAKRVAELTSEQTKSIHDFNILRHSVIQHKKRADDLKDSVDDGYVDYGKTVWTKSTSEGPYVTINRVALKIETNNGTRTIMGWVCKDKEGKYVELAEEDLTSKHQYSYKLDTDWPLISLVVISLLLPVVFFGSIWFFI